MFLACLFSTVLLLIQSRLSDVEFENYYMPFREPALALGFRRAEEREIDHFIESFPAYREHDYSVR